MSESEEMYLVVIARANENGQDPVPLAQVAADLHVQPVSANQMIKKLEEAGRVTYTPYKGVELTQAGKAEAARILRHRRLWEVFLAENLGFAPEQADEIACRLEHVVTEDVAERLSAYLGSPQTSPQGKPIPSFSSPNPTNLEPGIPLVQVGAGEQVTVAVIQSSGIEKTFLQQTGIVPGCSLTMLAIQATGTCLLLPENFPPVQLAASVANNIRVRLVNSS
jgi:DtxR family Mn-dependent transcriptional regulator